MKSTANKYWYSALTILLVALFALQIYRPTPERLGSVRMELPARPIGITQIATIDSLLAGVYDGEMTLEELGRYGNFGIGTFQSLDGEMVLLDGNFYQVKADGKVYRPNPAMTTPFASVLFFPEQTIRLDIDRPTDFEALCREMDRSAPNTNVPIAVRIEGRFSKVRTRSVPAQAKPYKPLAEVTKHQPEFDFDSVDGVIVGFRLPDYVRGINVPGYHLHFLDSERKQGGHLLHLDMETGTAEIGQAHHFRIVLPEKVSAFSDVDFSKDRSEELEKVEK